MPVLCSTKVQNSPGLHQTLVMTTLKLSWLGTRAAYFWASNPFPGATLLKIEEKALLPQQGSEPFWGENPTALL